jgi:hypothetical protein
MKLFLVHCGFYDPTTGDGIYESHVNFFVTAPNFEEARLKAKTLPAFKDRRMHVDGLQEIEAVDGYRIHLEADTGLHGESRVNSNKHRDLAPKPATTST